MKVRTSVQISFHFVGESFDGNAELRRQKFNEVVGRLAKTESSTPTQDEINKIKDLVDHGSAPARYLYGQWQMEGIGVPRDAASGFVQVRRAAEMRYPPAMFDVAQAQLQGDGMPKDENQASILMHEAADSGSRQAQFSLGAIYEAGNRVPKDIRRAQKYFQLCAASGTAECQYRLGKLFLQDSGLNNDHWQQGLAWMELADQHGVAAAHAIVEEQKAKLHLLRSQTRTHKIRLIPREKICG